MAKRAVTDEEREYLKHIKLFVRWLINEDGKKESSISRAIGQMQSKNIYSLSFGIEKAKKIHFAYTNNYETWLRVKNIKRVLYAG